jgi:hypothetical protein
MLRISVDKVNKAESSLQFKKKEARIRSVGKDFKSRQKMILA